MDTVLRELGLSELEAAVYLRLLHTPNSTAQQLSQSSKITRTNMYRILDLLLERNLVTADSTPVKRFSAAEPHVLKELLQQEQVRLKDLSRSLNSALPFLSAQYALSRNKPGIIHLSGSEGFEQLLNDMVNSQTEVQLVASNFVPNDLETIKKFRELLLERKKNGVTTRALFHKTSDQASMRKRFTERGITVRFVDTPPFTGEVVIYENNVAFTVYEPSLIVTIVTNPQIAETMRSIFELAWSQSDE